MKDENTLAQQKLVKNSKVMLVGSKLNDVMAVNVISKEEKEKIAQEDKPVKEPLSKSKVKVRTCNTHRGQGTNDPPKQTLIINNKTPKTKHQQPFYHSSQTYNIMYG